jgi:Lrp/AsnC family leucine-responsive transcriptional regulator
MDRSDRKFLNLLQHEAPMPDVAMAEKVGLSASRCLRRVRQLQGSGIIERTVAILDPAGTGRVLKALVMVELKLHGGQPLRRLPAQATAEDAVLHAYAVTGETDVALMLRLRDMGNSTRCATGTSATRPKSHGSSR